MQDSASEEDKKTKRLPSFRNLQTTTMIRYTKIKRHKVRKLKGEKNTTTPLKTPDVQERSLYLKGTWN